MQIKELKTVSKKIILTILFILAHGNFVYADIYDAANGIFIVQKASLNDSFRPNVYIGSANENITTNYNFAYAKVNSLGSDYEGDNLARKTYNLGMALPLDFIQSFSNFHFHAAGTYTLISGKAQSTTVPNEAYSIDGSINWVQWVMGYDLFKMKNSIVSLYAGFNFLAAFLDVKGNNQSIHTKNLNFGYLYGVSYSIYFESFQMSAYWIFSDTFSDIKIDKRKVTLPIGGPGLKVDYALSDRYSLGFSVSGLLFSRINSYNKIFYDNISETSYNFTITHIMKWEGPRWK